MGISVQVIESIRRLNNSDRSVVVARLSAEIAAAQVIQEATLVRRLLLTGRKEGNIGGVEMAQVSISKAITELEEEINGVMFEDNLRKSMVTKTAKTVLKEAKALQDVSRNYTKKINAHNRPFINGKVSP